MTQQTRFGNGSQNVHSSTCISWYKQMFQISLIGIGRCSVTFENVLKSILHSSRLYKQYKNDISTEPLTPRDCPAAHMIVDMDSLHVKLSSPSMTVTVTCCKQSRTPSVINNSRRSHSQRVDNTFGVINQPECVGYPTVRQSKGAPCDLPNIIWYQN